MIIFSVRCKLACNKERLCAGFGRELGQQRCQMAFISLEGCFIWLGIFYVEHREFIDLLATFRQWLQYQLALFRARVGGFAKAWLEALLRVAPENQLVVVARKILPPLYRNE